MTKTFQYRPVLPRRSLRTRLLNAIAGVSVSAVILGGVLGLFHAQEPQTVVAKAGTNGAVVVASRARATKAS